MDGLASVHGVVPMEVKYGTNLKAKSLSSFVKKHDPDLALRVSSAPLSKDGVIVDVPYYLLGPLFAALLKDAPFEEAPEIARKRETSRPGSSTPITASFLRYLEGHSLSKQEIIDVYNARQEQPIDKRQAEEALSVLRAKGAIESKGRGRGSYWKLADKPENEYRLYEGKGLETPFHACSKIGLLEKMEDNSAALAELLPFDYFCVDDRASWMEFVDDLLVPDDPDDPDSIVDIVRNSGIPRILEPGQYVLNVQGHPDACGPEDEFFLIDIEDDTDAINLILQKVFPDYGYSIRKNAYII